MDSKDSISDEQLVADIRTGCEWAFTTLYNRYYKKLHMDANYQLKDAELAEDIVQEVFVTIWTRRDHLPENLTIKSYLITCVRNKCLDQYRKTLVHSKNAKLYSSMKEIIVNFNPMENKELSLQLNNAIQALPQAQRTIFEMSYLDNELQRDIAVKQNITLQTVKNQISTSLRILRQKLKSSTGQ